MEESGVKNILSFDLEDWHQLIQRRITGRASSPSDNLCRQVGCLLDLLQMHGAKATFFTLGMVAEGHPGLVKRIADEGHEIASHGYAHLCVDRLTRSEFAEDTKRAKTVLENLIGQPVRGYRAAEFSIGAASLWALEELSEQGFEYDSSIFPIHHRRYGIADFPSRVARYLLPNGLRIIEFPPATISIGMLNLPVAGGGYFRILPLWLIRRAIERLNGDLTPMVTYLHPYEFDPRPLNIFESLHSCGLQERLVGARVNFHQNVGRRTMPAKLAGLLLKFPFTTCRDYLQQVELHGSQTLF